MRYGGSNLSAPASCTPDLEFCRKHPSNHRTKAISLERGGHQSQILEPGDTEAQQYHSLRSI
jgi:hypothetical protein